MTAPSQPSCACGTPSPFLHDVACYQDGDGNPCSLDTLCRKEPEWAANRLRATQAALADMFALIDEGFLCRSTKLDDRSDWAITVTRGILRLANAHKQLGPEYQQGEQQNGEQA